MDQQQIDAFARGGGFGWMTPEGVVQACDFHDHFASMDRFPEFSNALARYREIADANNQSMQEDLDALGPDEHPAMHRFAFMNDDAAGDFIKVVYKAGWVRLGTATDSSWMHGLGATTRDVMRALREINRNDYKKVLEAEGLAEHVDHLERPLKNLALGIDARLTIRRMEYVVETYGRHGRQSREYLTVAK